MKPLFMAIVKGEFNQVKRLDDINVDAFSDENFHTPIIMNVLTSVTLLSE